MPGHFTDQLAAAVGRLASPVLVGLDPRWEQLPASFRAGGDGSLPARARAYEAFCGGVIDVVAPLVPAVKVQAAFFEALGPAGMAAMAAVIRHAQQSGLLVILDGKRNDIGSTAEAYARGYLGRKGSAWHADALTVSPYLGDDSLAPFVDVATKRGAGVFVLVKTSNPGSGMLQDLSAVGGSSSVVRGGEQRTTSATSRPIYRHVADHVERLATQTVGQCGYGSVGAVVGAKHKAGDGIAGFMAELRAAMPHTWFLVPGYGSQGGTAADVATAFDARGLGAIVNNSRGIIFAHARPEYAERFGAARWQEAVEAATRDMIRQLRDAVTGLGAGG